MVEDPPGDQGALDVALIIHAQKGAHLGDGAHLIHANRHYLYIGHGQATPGTVDGVTVQPSGGIRTRKASVEVLWGEVGEGATVAIGIEVVIIGNLVVQHWHGSIIRTRLDCPRDPVGHLHPEHIRALSPALMEC